MEEKRKCLFCPAEVPGNMGLDDMIYERAFPRKHGVFSRSKPGWYSNGLFRPETPEEVARFFICPTHLGRLPEAWEWARGH